MSLKYVTYLTTYGGSLLPPLYIGSTSEDKVLSGNYFGSILSKKWKGIFKQKLKNNKNLFSIQILSTHLTREEALEAEYNLQKMFNAVESPKYINEAYAHKKFFHGNKHSEETKKRLSDITKNTVFTEDKKKDISNTISLRMKQAWKNPKHRINLFKGNFNKNLGRSHSLKSKLNMSIAHIGFKQTEEQINKRAAKLLGSKRTQEQKQRMSQTQRGKKISSLGRLNMSIAAKHRKISLTSRLELSKKISAHSKKPRKYFILISPNNTEYRFEGLQAVFRFAKDNNLSLALLKSYKNRGKIMSKVSRCIPTVGWELRVSEKICNKNKNKIYY